MNVSSIINLRALRLIHRVNLVAPSFAFIVLLTVGTLARCEARLEAVPKERGIEVILDAETQGFSGQQRVEVVRLRDGRSLPADLVVTAIGIQPSIELAQQSGIHCQRGIVVDHAMQMFGGMGMTREMPLYLLSNKLRTMRIYDGPSEIHNWVVARDLLGTRE